MWSDRETSQDCLGYSSYVSVLSNVCTHKDLAPLTLGIFGPWGSGKTSLMQMLQQEIESSKGDFKRKTIWFNAWMYEGREEAQTALIHAILRLLQDDVSLTGEAKQLWDKLRSGASVLKLSKFIMKSAITLTPDIGGFVDAFQDESGRVAETMESFEADLKKLLELVKVDRIVVFIDDLDRCSSIKVIETFETIKLFLNTPACTFVIGADADKIKQAVGEIYSVGDAKRQKDYLEKIVQIPFSIPAQDLHDIGCYVGMLLVGRHLNDDASKQLINARSTFIADANQLSAFVTWAKDNRFAIGDATDEVIAQLGSVLPHIDVIARGLSGNPRQIKRFLNILSLRQQLVVANHLNTKPELLLKFAVLEYVWDSFFGALAETADPKTGKSELLGQLAQVAAGKKPPEESDVVSKWTNEPGLIDFLASSPAIDGETDLQPYLFLAQTSLSRNLAAGLVAIDETTRQLVRTIEGTDRILSRSASKRAAQNSTVAAAVVRQIIADLRSAKDATAIVNMLAATELLAKDQPEFFKAVIEPVRGLDASNPAITLAASNMLAAAQKAGVEVPQPVLDKFAKSSKIAEALRPRVPPRRKE